MPAFAVILTNDRLNIDRMSIQGEHVDEFDGMPLSEALVEGPLRHVNQVARAAAQDDRPSMGVFPQPDGSLWRISGARRTGYRPGIALCVRAIE